jgi:hypothetical protein
MRYLYVLDEAEGEGKNKLYIYGVFHARLRGIEKGEFYHRGSSRALLFYTRLKNSFLLVSANTACI